MNTGNVVTPLSFRDGREYIVSLTVIEHPKSFSIVITDKITAEEWSCLYDLKYVEDLTQRAGSYKQFDVFLSMIKGSILKSTDSVTTDLLSVEDLKKLKSKRLRQGLHLTNELSLILNNLENVSSISSPSKKKYLIVTYRSEFDNVHYPISLNYSGPPDPLIMQNTIQRLQGEVSHLRSTNVDLLSQLKYRVKICENEKHEKHPVSSGENGDSPTSKSGPNVFSCGLENSEHLDSLDNGKPHIYAPAKSYSSELGYNIVSMQKLVAAMHKLEERILSERAEHFEQMEKLMSENNFLQRKLEQLLCSEADLKERIERLENLLNSNMPTTIRQRSHFLRFRRDGLNLTNDSTAHQAQHRSSSGSNCQFKNEKLPRREAVTHFALRSRTSTDSAQTSDSQNRPPWKIPNNNSGKLSQSRFPIFQKQSNNATITVRSRSASPRFDPTAYVKDKKSRQEDIQKLRLSRIETRYRGRERQTRRDSVLKTNSAEVEATSENERRSRNSSTDRTSAHSYSSSAGSNLGRVRFADSRTNTDLRQRSMIRVNSKSPVGKTRYRSPSCLHKVKSPSPVVNHRSSSSRLHLDERSRSRERFLTMKSASPVRNRQSRSPRLRTKERAEARSRSRERALETSSVASQVQNTERIRSKLNIPELNTEPLPKARSRSQSSPSWTTIGESVANSGIDRELLDTCKKADLWTGSSRSTKPKARDSQIFSNAGNWHERFAKRTGVMQESSLTELEEPLNELQKFIDSTHTRLVQAAEAGRLA